MVTSLSARRDAPGASASPVPAVCLGGCAFFGATDAAGPLLRLKAGAPVYRRGAAAHHCFKVLDGTVRISRVSADGQRQVLDFARAGETFGIELSDTFGADAEAVGDAVLLRCPRACISHLTAREENACRKLMAMLSGGLSAAQEHVMLLGRQSAKARVAAFLLRLAADETGDACVLTLAMRRQDIADYLGLTLETTSRMLTELKNDGLVAVPGRREIRIPSRRRLRALADR